MIFKSGRANNLTRVRKKYRIISKLQSVLPREILRQVSAESERSQSPEEKEVALEKISVILLPRIMHPVGVLNALLDVICSPTCLVDIVVDPFVI